LHKKLKPICENIEEVPTQEEIEVLGWKDSLHKLSQDVELQQKFVKRMKLINEQMTRQEASLH
jgi:hypothetical protein